MIEAELKARLANPDAVREALRQHAAPEVATYRDTYYDTADRRLDGEDRELRVRSVETPKLIRHFLTYKEPAADQASQSKPEYETTVLSVDAVRHIVEGLGYGPVLHLTKECENYRFEAGGRRFVATIARVPEIDGTFLEVETMAPKHELDAALTAVRAVMSKLGVTSDELTTAKYTDAVRAARSRA